MSAVAVYLPPHGATASTEFDYVVTLDGVNVESHGAAAPALLPMAARAGAELVAIAPASMLSWHKVELPKGTSATSPRARAVLEGLLEDQLLDDPEAMHFALQPGAATSTAWVVVCVWLWFWFFLF